MSLKLIANLHLNMGWLEDDRFFLGAKASLADVKLAVSFRKFFGFPETNSDSFPPEKWMLQSSSSDGKQSEQDETHLFWTNKPNRSNHCLEKVRKS